MRAESHLSDRDLLRAVDGELSPGSLTRIQRHLEKCGVCRARQEQIDQASASFAQLHLEGFDSRVQAASTARASLKARLAEAAASYGMFSGSKTSPQWLTLGACAAVLAMLSVLVLRREAQFSPEVVSVPNRTLTPGLAAPVSRQQICATEKANNRIVPVVLRRRVFQEYGIPNAAPPAYEVDYLITPALGGADDIRNLWPQSYSSTVWNAQVKDALEDRLRDLVCDGKLDLATAQRDIAADWIGAYKKYFQTDRPVDR